MANFFGEIAFWPSGKICLNTGWEINTVLITLQTAMRFLDCYKAIIDTLCNFDNFKNFSLIDSCTYSDDEQITLKEWDPITADKITYYTGDGTETVCTPGKLFSPAITGFVHEVLMPILYPEE